MTAQLVAEHLLLEGGWASPGHLAVDEGGLIAAAAAGPPPPDWAGAQRIDGFVVPGVPNVHSHAHQRLLAGRAEFAGGDERGNLWTWRELMYRLAERLDPDLLEAAAAQAYVEMLEAGFTAVGEFHYVHHGPDGRPYADPAEMSRRIFAAADATGIGLTHLPVLYQTGGVRGQAVTGAQRRFAHDLDSFGALVATCADTAASRPGLWRVGAAPHSLRAVGGDSLKRLAATMAREWPAAPVHIHVAERREEVKECLDGLGARPIEWLLDGVEADDRWTLVHATHCSPAEREAMATAGATVGLCPATEANLGDGLFPLVEFDAAGGAWAVGTDMNHAISVVEELRTLEVGQRLRLESRVLLGAPEPRHAGAVLLDRAWRWGARSIAQPIGRIAAGLRADLVVLDPTSPALAAHGTATVLDAWLLSSTDNPVRGVMVGGRWRVRDGRHHERDVTRTRFVAAARAAAPA